MRKRKIPFFLIAFGVLLIVGASLWASATPVQAQCGSQASSCKNCHETQAQDPVNNDATTWHSQHSFGDFCYLCHGGNSQSTDKTAAHMGMVDPLANVTDSCKSCHAKDYQDLAQQYATTLGVTIANIGAGSSPTGQAASPTQEMASASTAVPAASVPASEMVDYSQRYNEIALGQKSPNVGNIVLIVLIAALVLGGGFLVARREGWIKISFQDTKTIQGSYPTDVVEMVPDLAKLKLSARKDLRQILAKPATAAEVFALVTKLARKEEKPLQAEEQTEKEKKKI
jgi:hypothetical protein